MGLVTLKININKHLWPQAKALLGHIHQTSFIGEEDIQEKHLQLA